VLAVVVIAGVVVVAGGVVVVVVVVVVVGGGELVVVVGGGCRTGELGVVEVLEDVLDDVDGCDEDNVLDEDVSDDDVLDDVDGCDEDVVPDEDVVVSDDDVGPTIAGTGAPAGGATTTGGSVALGSRFSTLTDKRFIWSSRSCLRAPLSTVCTVELTAASLSCAADH
jgi:hypothetical protein